MIQPRHLVAAVALVAFAAAVDAQKPVVYPAKGQSSQQKQKDGGGERVRGAARGAVGGAVIGGIAGDAGTGAAVGAAAGTMAGGARARNNQAAQNQQAVQQQQDALNTYYRAYGACMEGRGYTIK